MVRGMVVAGGHPRPVRPIDVLVGRKLEYVRLGHAIVMGFTGGHQVVLESVAHMNGPHGHVVVEPGESPSDVLAMLLGDVVRTAHTRGTGELEITFAGGSELCVGVDADFESWAVTGPDGLLIVCVAGGELAVWGAGDAGETAA